MAIQPSGHIFFEDEYTQKYEVQWETINGILDITTITQQPYVWGEADDVKINNGILYRRGVVTIHRQAIEPFSDGYMIVAEGVAQYIDYIQMNFPCERGPTDNFRYHLNCSILDNTHIKVFEGPHWADPSDADDDNMVWCDLNIDGSPSAIGSNYLQWLDVWSN